MMTKFDNISVRQLKHAAKEVRGDDAYVLDALWCLVEQAGLGANLYDGNTSEFVIFNSLPWPDDKILAVGKAGMGWFWLRDGVARGAAAARVAIEQL